MAGLGNSYSANSICIFPPPNSVSSNAKTHALNCCYDRRLHFRDGIYIRHALPLVRSHNGCGQRAAVGDSRVSALSPQSET